MKGRKKDTLSTGRMGETLAVKFLNKEGFRVFHTNWRAGHKELDIVAGKKDRIHFVEVRSRSSADVVSPAQTVGWSKQRLVMSAARAYMARYRIQAEAQFDVISIVFGPGGIGDPDYTLEYIPNAFTLLL
jgi:putative endonuclease